MTSKKLCALACSAAVGALAFSAVIPANASSGDYQPSHALSNPNADESAMRTYDYICDNFGQYMLSGQQESTWMDSNPDYEMDYIEETTGKLPAIRGLDFMNGDFDGVVERAEQWHDKGGIVTICWHTGVDGNGYNEALGDNPDFDKLLTEGTDEHDEMIANWDKAAQALKELEEAGVPVLWRPFHEFDGKWFWWGKGDAENFKKLWQMMYDYFTDEYELNNLIWVLGYADDVNDGWYPGDEYCDIIGSDTYKDSRKTNKYAWDKLLEVTDAEKPLAFHECGNLPSVEDFENDGCLWSWFMVWHTDYITNNNTANLSEVYNSEKVITLDELPDLSAYDGPVREDQKIAFIGDSICAGCDWAELFEYEKIDNFGICGNTTDDVWARFDCIDDDYDKLFIICGVNDWKVDGWNDGSYSGSMENYKNMFEKAAEYNPDIEVYVTGILPTCGQYTSYIDYHQSENYNAKLKELAANYDYVTFVDGVWDALIDEETGYGDEDLYRDGLHPNSDGYQAIKPVLQPYIDADIPVPDPDDSSSIVDSSSISSSSEGGSSSSSSAANSSSETSVPDSSSGSVSGASSSTGSAASSGSSSSKAGSTSSTSSKTENPNTGAKTIGIALIAVFCAGAAVTVSKKNK